MSASCSKRVYVRSFCDDHWFYFTYEWKVIFTTKTSHLDSLWRGGRHELGNGPLDWHWRFESRKSRDFTGHFRGSQFPLYLKNGVDLSRQTSQSVCFLLPWKHLKRSAFLNKRLAGSQMAFRSRKVFGTFEKRYPEVYLIRCTPNFDMQHDVSL